MVSKAERTGWRVIVGGALLCALCSAASGAQAKVRFVGREVQRSDDGAAPSAASARGSADAAIEQMAQEAGIIFVGQVTSVRMPVGFAGSGQDAAEGLVEVDFRVDVALRGPAAGSIYTLREWTGLWTCNSRRYRVGQRLLLFLYAPDARGLSSPVHGMEGAIPLCGGGDAPGPDDSISSAAEWNADLRWVQAQVLRQEVRFTLSVGGAPRSPILRQPGRGVSSQKSAGEGVGREGASSYVTLPGNVQSGSAKAEVAESRRLPAVSTSLTQIPAQAEPLSYVVALCEQAMQERTSRERGGSR